MMKVLIILTVIVKMVKMMIIKGIMMEMKFMIMIMKIMITMLMMLMVLISLKFPLFLVRSLQCMLVCKCTSKRPVKMILKSDDFC